MKFKKGSLRNVCFCISVCLYYDYFFAMELIYHLDDEEIKSGLCRRCYLGDIQRVQVISFWNGCNSVLNSLVACVSGGVDEESVCISSLRSGLISSHAVDVIDFSSKITSVSSLATKGIRCGFSVCGCEETAASVKLITLSWIFILTPDFHWPPLH